MLHDTLTVGRADIGDHRTGGHDSEYALHARKRAKRDDRHIRFDDTRAIVRIGRFDLDTGHATQAVEQRSTRNFSIERDPHERATCLVVLHRVSDALFGYSRARRSDAGRRRDLIQSAAEIRHSVFRDNERR